MFMPSETTRKDHKLTRPYHGPYCIVSLTATNAEVKLIERPREPSIFVAVTIATPSNLVLPGLDTSESLVRSDVRR